MANEDAEISSAGLDTSLIDVQGNPESGITIRVHLVHVVGPVQNELQAILDCARLACEGIEKLSVFSGGFADARFHVEPAGNRRMQLNQLRNEARRRIFRAAVQDAVELVHFPLEQARRILVLWKLCKRNAEGLGVNLADIENGAQEFHKLPLEYKLKFLRREHGFEVNPQAIEIVQSLSRARNCIVHRLGHVTPLDCDKSGVLKASWEEYAVFASLGQADLSNARRVPIGATINEGEAVHIQRVTSAREFLPGDQIELTGQDVNGICHTMHLFSSQVRDDLRVKGLALGFRIDGQLMDPVLGRKPHLHFVPEENR